MNKPRVLVRGSYGVGNFGDDILMIATYRLLRECYPPEEIIFLSQATKYVQQIEPGIRTIDYRSKLSSVDLEVYGGGTQFYSFCHKESGRSFYQNIYKAIRCPRKAFYYMLDRYWRNRPKIGQRVAIGIGVGPFVSNSEEETDVRRLFVNMDYISVRDDYSYKLLKIWGIPQVSYWTDLAFMERIWPEVSHLDLSHTLKPRKIAIIIRDWPHTIKGAAYQKPLKEVVQKLRNQGYHIVYILFKKNDVQWIETLNDMREEYLLWNPQRHTVETFLSSLNEFDCFLTARYHGAVIGAILGKPVICIEVEQKLRLISEVLSEGRLLWKPPFTSKECIKLIEELTDNYQSVTQDITNARKREFARAKMMMEEFISFCKSE